MTADFAAVAAQTVMDGRALVEALMTDSCTITRPDPDAVRGEMDLDTMQYPPLDRITVYAGKCRLQIKSVVASSSDSSAGDRLGVVQDFELQIPVDGTKGVAINDVAEIVTAVSDDSLEGRLFTITARHEKSQATARRLRVSEVTA